jgi:hypothetical protein
MSDGQNAGSLRPAGARDVRKLLEDMRYTLSYAEAMLVEAGEPPGVEVKLAMSEGTKVFLAVIYGTFGAFQIIPPMASLGEEVQVVQWAYGKPSDTTWAAAVDMLKRLGEDRKLSEERRTKGAP